MFGMKSLWGKIQSLVMVVMIAMAIVAIPACASLKNVFSGQSSGSATAKVVVQVSVFNLITEKPEYKSRILDITKSVKTYIDATPTARADAIVGLVAGQIKWDKLSAEERITVQALLAVIQTNLEEKIGDNTLPADLKLSVGTLIEWIESVVQPYSGASAKTDHTEFVIIKAQAGPIIQDAYASSALASTETIGRAKTVPSSFVIMQPALAGLLLKYPNNDGQRPNNDGYQLAFG